MRPLIQQCCRWRPLSLSSSLQLPARCRWFAELPVFHSLNCTLLNSTWNTKKQPNVSLRCGYSGSQRKVSGDKRSTSGIEMCGCPSFRPLRWPREVCCKKGKESRSVHSWNDLYESFVYVLLLNDRRATYGKRGKNLGISIFVTVHLLFRVFLLAERLEAWKTWRISAGAVLVPKRPFQND